MTDENHPTEMVPSVECSRCGRTWELSYELDQRHAGNQALEQFAMDHHRHTGHFPDEVRPYTVNCRRCPEADQYLSERPARRFAETHARHTGHSIELSGPGIEEPEQFGPDSSGEA